MKRKKVFALLISLTMLINTTLPGTLAVSVDQAAANDSFTLAEETLPSTPEEEQQEPENQEEHGEQKGQGETPEDPTESEKTCTCGSTDGTHAEDCPLYEAPAAPEKTCTCGSSNGTHAEDCPLYVKQIELSEEVEIKYQVVGPENCGSLDSESERLPLPIIGSETGSASESPNAASGDSVAAIGATPTAAEGFKFVGWYKDEACTQPVDESWVSDDKLIPGKTKNYGTAEAPAMGYEAATYYAKFEIETASLTIIRQRSSEETNENQHFIFDVTGTNGYCKRVVINGNSSITIKGLVAGEYTIKEVTGYRMDDSSKKITLQPAKDGTVDFSCSQNEQEWLSGDAYRKITFGD